MKKTMMAETIFGALLLSLGAIPGRAQFPATLTQAPAAVLAAGPAATQAVPTCPQAINSCAQACADDACRAACANRARQCREARAASRKNPGLSRGVKALAAVGQTERMMAESAQSQACLNVFFDNARQAGAILAAAPVPAPSARQAAFPAAFSRFSPAKMAAPAAVPVPAASPEAAAVLRPAPEASPTAGMTGAEDFFAAAPAAALAQDGQDQQGRPAPDYRSRPQRQPDYNPYEDQAPYADNSVSPDGDWHLYVDFLGQATETAGAWTAVPQEGQVARGGSEVGGQSADYTLTLTSHQSRSVYRLYWRWHGRECDANDSGRCAHWKPEFQYFFDRTQDGTSSSVTIKIHFSGDKALLPWEKDVIGFSYDGGKISIDQSGAAFNYAVRGPVVDQQTGVASVTLVPGSRILRAPERDKVRLDLEKSGGRLLLSVTDDRAAYYAGETLLIAVTIKKDSGHWYKPDQTVFERRQNGPFEITVSASNPTRVLADMSWLGQGKFHISGWSFSRSQSKISSDAWVGEGKGGSIQN